MVDAGALSFSLEIVEEEGGEIGVESAVKIGEDIGMASTVEANIDIVVEAVVELGLDSTAVVGGKADTDVEPIIEALVEIPAAHRGYPTSVEDTP